MVSVRVGMMIVGMVAVGCAAVMARAHATTEAGGEADAEVLRLRESAWRAWFSGDEAALRRILPADFVGISSEAGPLATLDVVIQQSREFHGAGGRLVTLDFPETRFQRYGDVVILYGRYVAVIQSGGTTKTLQGRLTEMFLKRAGVWVHTGWHLDTVS